MSSIYYGIFLAVILFVIRWYIVSERTQGGATGILGRLNMSPPDELKRKSRSGRSVETPNRHSHRA
jgi:hypothetical protein